MPVRAVRGAPTSSQDSKALQPASSARLFSPARNGQTASSCAVLSAVPAVPADQTLLPCDASCLKASAAARATRLHLQALRCSLCSGQKEGLKTVQAVPANCIQGDHFAERFRCRFVRKAYLRIKSAVTVIQLAWQSSQSWMLLRSASLMSAFKSCILGLQSAVNCDWQSANEAVDDSEVDSLDQSACDSACESVDGSAYESA